MAAIDIQNPRCYRQAKPAPKSKLIYFGGVNMGLEAVQAGNRADQALIKSLSQETDAELYHEGLLLLGYRFEQAGKLKSAAQVYSQILENKDPNRLATPQLMSQAKMRMDALSGKGPLGLRLEFLTSQFVRTAVDPSTLVGLGAAGVIYKTARFATMSRLLRSPAANFFTRSYGAASATASLTGFALETPAFLLGSKLTDTALGRQVHWDASLLGKELAYGYLIFGGLRFAGWGSNHVLKRIPKIKPPIPRLSSLPAFRPLSAKLFPRGQGLRLAGVTLLALALAACKNSAKKEGSSATPEEKKPTRPNAPGENAILWSKSDVYAATTKQIYRNATQQLQKIMAARKDKTRPAAVVVDVDETLLDNSAFQAWMAINGKEFTTENWEAWCNAMEAEAIPGAVEFLNTAEKLGATVFYLTNRHYGVEGDTRFNLKMLGFNLEDREPLDRVLTLQERPDWKKSKDARRAHIAKNYDIVMFAGDQRGDFPAKQKGTEEPWGKNWFIIPNPMYGHWKGKKKIDDMAWGGPHPPIPPVVKKVGNITVIEANQAIKKSKNQINDRQVLRAFYGVDTSDPVDHFRGDHYDVVAIYANYPVDDIGAFAYSYNVKNTVAHIGLPTHLDETDYFGSAGNLNSYLFMNDLADYPAEPSQPITSRGYHYGHDVVMTHEFAHLVCCYVSSTQGAISEEGSHWSYLWDTYASYMHGASWRGASGEDPLNVKGFPHTFTAKKPFVRYSNYDRYLLGDFDDVADLSTVIEDRGLLNAKGVEVWKEASEGDQVKAGKVSRITIQSIIDKEGGRRKVLDPSDVNKTTYRMAFILLVPEGTSGSINASHKDIVKLEAFRTQFEKNFNSQMSRISMDTSLQK